MNVLSLFDGMSCGQIALNQLGIDVDNYYASEIDKHAIKVTMENYPNTIQLGNITKWREWDIDFSKIDLVYGGSPCQGFSFAGKQLAFNDARSKLFFEFIDILNHIKSVNPNIKFLLENVRMKKEFIDVITSHIGVKPVTINSSLVSAQNRIRLYWTNISDIEQPLDRHIYLKDIIEDGFVDKDKSYCIDANYFKGGNLKSYFEKSRRQLVFTGCIQVGEADIKGYDAIKRVYSIDGKSPTLTAVQGGNQEPKIAVYEATKKGYAEAGIGEGLDLTFPESKTRRGRLMKEKSNCLTASNYDYGIVSKDGSRVFWRKLTPIECERLQTVPDNYTSAVSNTQRYRMLGNGWTVEVIKHIFKGLK